MPDKETGQDQFENYIEAFINHLRVAGYAIKVVGFCLWKGPFGNFRASPNHWPQPIVSANMGFTATTLSRTDDTGPQKLARTAQRKFVTD